MKRFWGLLNAILILGLLAGGCRTPTPCPEQYIPNMGYKLDAGYVTAEQYLDYMLDRLEKDITIDEFLEFYKRLSKAKIVLAPATKILRQKPLKVL